MTFKVYTIPHNFFKECLDSGDVFKEGYEDTYRYLIPIENWETSLSKDAKYDFTADVCFVTRDSVPYLYCRQANKLTFFGVKPRKVTTLLEALGLVTIVENDTVGDSDGPAWATPEQIEANREAIAKASKRPQSEIEPVRALVISASSVASVTPLIGVELTHDELKATGLVLMPTPKHSVCIQGQLDKTEYRNKFNNYVAGRPENALMLVKLLNKETVRIEEILSYDAAKSAFCPPFSKSPELWFVAVVDAAAAENYPVGKVLSKEQVAFCSRVANKGTYYKRQLSATLPGEFYADYAMSSTDVLFVAYRKAGCEWYSVIDHPNVTAGDIGI